MFCFMVFVFAVRFTNAGMIRLETCLKCSHVCMFDVCSVWCYVSFAVSAYVYVSVSPRLVRPLLFRPSMPWACNRGGFLRSWAPLRWLSVVVSMHHQSMVHAARCHTPHASHAPDVTSLYGFAHFKVAGTARIISNAVGARRAVVAWPGTERNKLPQ